LSLYRQAGRAGARTLAGVGIGALVAGGGIGYAIGASGGDDSTSSVRDAVAAMRADLAPAASGLELVATEYPQGVRGGKVVAQTEYTAAKADVERARQAIERRADDLRALSAERYAALEQSLDDLGVAIARVAPEDAVKRLASRAAGDLAALRGRSG
jgi:hypothetical protein